MKELGRYQLVNLLEGLEGFSLTLFIKYLRWSQEKLQLFLVDVRKNLVNSKIHTAWELVVVNGQKPRQDPSAFFE